MTTAKALGLPIALVVLYFAFGWLLLGTLTDPPSPFSWLTSLVGAAGTVVVWQVKGFVRYALALAVAVVVAALLTTPTGFYQLAYGFAAVAAAYWVGIFVRSVALARRWGRETAERADEIAAVAEEFPPAVVGDDVFAVAEATHEDLEEQIDVTPEPIIVGLCGYAGAGKDTAAQGLLWTGEWSHASFASKLKDFLLAVNPLIPVSKGMRGYEDFNIADLPTVFVRYADYVEKVGGIELAKDNPEVRELLQRVGTDAGRKVIGEDVWVDAAMADLPSGNVVFTDVRFPNEARAIQDAGGYVIRVIRDGHGPVNGHPSETALDDFPIDAAVVNDGSMRDLHQKIKAAVAMLEHQHADGHHLAGCC